ncbi:hypothetical protein [Actinokineospora iranica]|uniref:Uncharacterized protein n=1 Tax=Actinokineospora iranica TaxID=1271860 RepID=A0A1G6K2R8_9PSEU|nr:hypothetical protein [Actinokineospora iranica]SDC25247.1 hypothetical protein SAMN05216174_101684 [Actinokineospora iranica]
MTHTHDTAGDPVVLDCAQWAFANLVALRSMGDFPPEMTFRVHLVQPPKDDVAFIVTVAGLADAALLRGPATPEFALDEPVGLSDLSPAARWYWNEICDNVAFHIPGDDKGELAFQFEVQLLTEAQAEHALRTHPDEGIHPDGGYLS